MIFATIRWIDWISMIGSSLSLIGVVINLWQIMKVKKVAKVATETVKETIKKYEREISITQIAKHIETIELIRILIRKANWEVAEIKMHNLKECLIELEQIEATFSILKKESYSENMSNLNVDIFNISEVILNKGTRITPNNIISHLNKIAEMLLTVENKLKHQQNGDQN